MSMAFTCCELPADMKLDTGSKITVCGWKAAMALCIETKCISSP